jgi:hypothetical protein
MAPGRKTRVICAASNLKADRCWRHWTCHRELASRGSSLMVLTCSSAGVETAAKSEQYGGPGLHPDPSASIAW